MYDVAIIGTGIAGLSAALTLKLHEKSIIWFGSKNLSEKLRRAEKIANYPGLPLISGEDFAAALKNQAALAGLEITEKTITGLIDGGDRLMLAAGNDFYEAKSVIIATGVESARPLEGELRLLGRGVSYCATCDGFLYKGKPIAAVCTSAELEHEVEYLASLASSVTYFPLYKKVGALPDNVVVSDDLPREILGDQRVSAVKTKNGEYPCEAVFVLKSAYAPSAIANAIAVDGGHIKVDSAMRTNIRGVFAAGDVTGRPYQYAKAAGEGNIAAHSTVDFLREANTK